MIQRATWLLVLVPAMAFGLSLAPAPVGTSAQAQAPALAPAIPAGVRGWYRPRLLGIHRLDTSRFAVARAPRGWERAAVPVEKLAD